MAREETEWLRKEIPKWVERDWITSDQADRITRHYENEEEEPAYSLAFMLLSGLAALLVGSGLILIVAYNWSDFGRSMRTLISLFPLLLGLGVFGWALFRRSDQVAWRESGSAFLMLMLAASLGLIAQTYRIMTEPAPFVLAWLLLSIPLLYALRSSLCTILYLGGTAAYALQDGYVESGWFFGLLLISVPHLVMYMRKQDHLVRKNLLEWMFFLATLIGWMACVEMDTTLFGILGTSVLFPFFIGWGQKLEGRDSIFLFPFQFLPLFGVYLMVLLLTFGLDHHTLQWGHWFQGKEAPSGSAFWNGVTLLCLVLGWLYFTIPASFLSRSSLSAKRSYSTWVILGFPVYILIYIFCREQVNETAGLLWMNGVGAGIGLVFLAEGLRHNSLFHVNAGLAFIVTLVIVRFFDESWSFVWKGIVFVLVGLAFLVTNWRLQRRMGERESG